MNLLLDMKKNTALKNAIVSKGMRINYIEQQTEMPTNTLANHINQGRAIPKKHLKSLKKLLKALKIDYKLK
jgi:hypothetical protein